MISTTISQLPHCNCQTQCKSVFARQTSSKTENKSIQNGFPHAKILLCVGLSTGFPSALSFSQPCGHGPNCCQREDSCCPLSERAQRRQWRIWMRPTHSTSLATARLSPQRTTSSPSATWPIPLCPPGLFPPRADTHNSLTLQTRGCSCQGSALHQATSNSTTQGRYMPSICSRERRKNWTPTSYLATLTP